MKIEIVGFGKIRCLHCGDLFNLDGDIHLCNAVRNEWLDNQEDAYMQMPNGDLFDMKRKECVR